MWAGLSGYEVVFIAQPSGRIEVLEEVQDAERAMSAFRAAQHELRHAGRTGELVLIDQTNIRRPLLREALHEEPAALR